MTDKIIGEGVLGEKVQGARRQLDPIELVKSNVSVVYTSDEVTSNCPVTGQPDWYTVSITIGGAAHGIESKSLKLYLQSFRDEGQFCETFADTIARDVFDCTKAEATEVLVAQKPRGGVSIRAVSRIVRTPDGRGVTVREMYEAQTLTSGVLPR